MIRPPVYCADGTVWIFLTQGKVAEIDGEDSDLVTINWTAAKRKKTWYATGRIDGKPVYLHREIGRRKGIPDDSQVDHKDNCGLSNRRSNLRAANNSQNSCNRSRQSNNTSGFKGVAFCRQTNRWKAYIVIDKKQRWLGRFDTAEEASFAYSQAAIEIHAEFARLA